MFSLRNWQKRAVAKLSGHRYCLLKAVTGSGKSVAIAKLAHDFYKQRQGCNPKIIVTVPSKGIGQNFTDIQITEGNVNFKPDSDKVLTDDVTGKTDSIIQHLDEKTNTFESSIVICCHQSFLKAVNRNPEKFVNCMVVADEFHHCNGDKEKNELGKAIEQITKADNYILMVTATPFRSDGADLFPSDISNKVVKFSYTMSEYLADCKYLREIKFDGHFYDHVTTYHPGLSEYFAKKGISKSIVFLPNVRLHDRRVEAATVLAAALGMDARDNTGGIQLLAELKNPISGNYVRTNQDEVVWEYRHKETNRKLIVIDLDDDNEIRNYRLKWLAKNRKVEENTDYLIISLQMFIEGGDFPALDRVINLRYDNSLLRMIQKWGRATRDYPGKSVATFVQFMNTNEAYGTEGADNLSEGRLQDVVALHELDIDLDAIEIQRLAMIRGHIIVKGSKNPPPPKDDSEKADIDLPNSDQASISIKGFLASNWQHILAYTLIGGVVGTAIHYIADYINKN